MIFEDRDAALAVAARDEPARYLGNRRTILCQRNEANAWLDEGFELRRRAAMQAQRIAIRQGPAEPRCGEAEGREVRHDLDLGSRDELQNLSRHAVIRGIAGGEKHGLASAQSLDLLRRPR